MWKKYRKMWAEADMPKLEDITGNHTVRLAIAPWWDDCKVISAEVGSDLVSGWNVTPEKVWGFFRGRYAPDCMVLDYDYTCNTKLARRIVDDIRVCLDGTIIGKFYIRIWGITVFLSWFTMERIDDE